MHEQTKTGGEDDDTTKDTAVQSKVPLNTCRAEQPAATPLLTHHFDDLCVRIARVLDWAETDAGQTSGQS